MIKPDNRSEFMGLLLLAKKVTIRNINNINHARVADSGKPTITT